MMLLTITSGYGLTPKSKKRRIGFPVSIVWSTNEEETKIRQDCIVTFNKLMKRGKTRTAFDFIRIPEGYHFPDKVPDPIGRGWRVLYERNTSRS
jgi:hypothetical protein